MKIFPAIDIKDKKCVRLIKGDFNNKTEYEISPVDQAGKYKDHGFKNLHIVDLDGALTGETVNLDIIKEIVHKFDLKIEVGGGVRRLIKGDFNNKTEYEISPVDQAGKYKDHGFKNLHIVDLDGALTGETVNLDIIKEIVHKFDLKIEVGGGVRSIDSIEKYYRCRS